MARRRRACPASGAGVKQTPDAADQATAEVLMLFGGLVTLANLVLSLAVGLRLVAAARAPGRGAELALWTYFLASAFLATLCLGAAYAGLADPTLALPPAASGLLIGVATGGMAAGAVAILAFTRRTFRPDAAWARATALGCGAVAVAGAALEGATEGFAVTFVPGPAHWLAWLGRTAPMLWVAGEALVYHVRLRRRLALGLADPLVADRFLLWGVLSAAGALNLAADAIARVVYVALGGSEGAATPDVARTVLVGTMGVTMILGSVSAGTLFLTFFPTPGYRRWVLARAARAAA
jgi:hypothetical protein